MFDGKVFDAIVQAFANFGVVITLSSALLAYLALDEGQAISEIADAGGLGLALGLLPGALAAIYVYLQVALAGLNP